MREFRYKPFESKPAGVKEAFSSGFNAERAASGRDGETSGTKNPEYRQAGGLFRAGAGVITGFS